MTTPNIEELRLLAQTLEFSDAVRCSIQRAADLLQSQAERIKELDVIVASYGELDVEQAKHIACMESDLDTLRAELNTTEVLLEECKMDWSGDVTQIKAEHKHVIDQLRAQLAESISNHEACKSANTMLLGEIAAIAATEPVAWMVQFSPGSRWVELTKEEFDSDLDGHIVYKKQAFFTHPMPAQDVTELVEALEMIVSTHQGHCEHHVGVSKHSYNLANIAEEALSKYKGVK